MKIRSYLAFYIKAVFRLATSIFRRTRKKMYGLLLLMSLFLCFSVGIAFGSNSPVVVTTVGVGEIPFGVITNPFNNQIYVTNRNSNNVSVIDGNTNTLVTTIPVGSGPYTIGFNPSNQHIYVSNSGGASVSVIDSKTNTVLTNIAVGGSPSGISVDPAANRIYIVTGNNGKVVVLDSTTFSVITSITVGGSPHEAAFNPTTNRLYVADYTGNLVAVIDTVSNTVLTTIPVGTNPQAININTLTNRIYVANVVSNNISVIDGSTNSVISTIAVGVNPLGVGVNPYLNRLYIANGGSNTISVIDATSNSVGATLPAGAQPYAVSVNTVTNYFYVTNSQSNTLSVIKDQTPIVRQSFNSNQIKLSGTSTLNFTLSNPDTTAALTNLSFTNNLPSQLVVSNTPGISNNCGSGSLNSNVGSSTLSVSGVNLAPGQTCTLSVNLTSTTVGEWVSTVNSIFSTETGSMPFNSLAILKVSAALAPSLTQQFNPTTILSGTTSQLGFTIHNPNADTELTNISFTDMLPSTIVIDSTPELTFNCEGGTIIANPGSNNITISGISLEINQNCNISFNVTSSAMGNWNNYVTSISSDQSANSTISVAATLTVTVNNPLPNLVNFYPASSVAGSNAFLLTVNGTNFVSGAIVRWNGNDRPTQFVSSSELVATITANDLITPGVAEVRVFNPGPGGGSSVILLFQIITGGNPIPTITGLSPDTVSSGGTTFDLTVNGANFVNDAVVQWNGKNQPTIFVNNKQLVANIAALDLVYPGVGVVIVYNPAPGGGYSNLSIENITPSSYPVPTTTGLGLTSITAGSPAFSLVVDGSNFVGASVVRWNGSDRATTYISNTRLVADIGASDIAQIGSINVTVANPTPSGGISNPQILSVVNGCLDLLVTNISDTTTCGSLRSAVQSVSGLAPSHSTRLTSATNSTINFALLRSSTITLNSPLYIPDGVTLSGLCTASGPVLSIKSSATDSLILGKGVNLSGLNILSLNGKPLVVPAGGGNRLQCITLKKQ